MGTKAPGAGESGVFHLKRRKQEQRRPENPWPEEQGAVLDRVSGEIDQVKENLYRLGMSGTESGESLEDSEAGGYREQEDQLLLGPLQELLKKIEDFSRRVRQLLGQKKPTAEQRRELLRQEAAIHRELDQGAGSMVFSPLEGKSDQKPARKEAWTPDDIRERLERILEDLKTEIEK